MIRYEGVSFVLISPKELSLPAYIKTEVLEKNNVPFIETTSLEDAMSKLDILYMTRIQRERFDDLDEYERLKDSYVLTRAKLASAKESMSVLHPLPRVNEISVDVDDDPRACYFKQALYGKFMRMSLILTLLEGSAGVCRDKTVAQDDKGCKCGNPKCISQIEQELPQRFKTGANGEIRCAYCDNLIERN